MKLDSLLYQKMQDGRYHDVYVVSFIPSVNEHSISEIRMKPFVGQGFPLDIRVECNREMRKLYPVESRFRMTASMIFKHGKEVLYNNYNWSWEAQ